MFRKYDGKIRAKRTWEDGEEDILTIGYEKKIQSSGEILQW